MGFTNPLKSSFVFMCCFVSSWLVWERNSWKDIMISGVLEVLLIFKNWVEV